MHVPSQFLQLQAQVQVIHILKHLVLRDLQLKHQVVARIELEVLHLLLVAESAGKSGNQLIGRFLVLLDQLLQLLFVGAEKVLDGREIDEFGLLNALHQLLVALVVFPDFRDELLDHRINGGQLGKGHFVALESRLKLLIKRLQMLLLAATLGEEFTQLGVIVLLHFQRVFHVGDENVVGTLGFYDWSHFIFLLDPE